MTKVWKYVIIAVLVLLALGVLLGGAGLLTGASLSRIRDGLALQERADNAAQAFNELERTLQVWFR